jgi:alpha,alpha-trehalose-phosphate synthase [UDP-forming]
LVASVFSYVEVQSDREKMERELDTRATLLGDGIRESVRTNLLQRDTLRIARVLNRMGNRAGLIGIAVYDSQGVRLATSPALPGRTSVWSPRVWESLTRAAAVSSIESLDGQQVHVLAMPLVEDGRTAGVVFLVHDASFIDDRLQGIWRTNFLRLLAHFVLITLTTMLVVRWSITGPIALVAKWMRGLRTGKGAPPPVLPRGDILAPLTHEVSLLAKSLAQARASAQQEARLRMTSESLWTAERLKEHVRTELREKSLFVVSNREPYMHNHTEHGPQCIVPAGGLVTALDPILRACGGMWVAHGSGTADREFADETGHLKVPPEDPSYTLHRVYLTKEEEEGYYYGFSNEGIWPLCHITHTRPSFQLDDWQQYQEVNRKFAEALLEDIEHEEAPLVLIQDYHFALLPMLVKEKRPDARVAIFWHIPWPNPEVFGICPWKEELLLGLLGADLIGFHTQFHCNNFLETVDRILESKTNWDSFSVERNRQVTMIRPFPISVAPPPAGEESAERRLPAEAARQALLQPLGISPRFIAVGVDRIDYTKGILERFLAVERLLQKYPEYAGQFTLLQLGAPSRTHIKRYHDLIAELDETAERINWAYQSKRWKPIVFLKAHHSHETINRFYRIADVCLVTSLHDGMNLVAKEFIASRTDEDGVLILSQFAGAANELQDAIIVNPYHTEEVAESIHSALTMDVAERTQRMKELRTVVRERNVFRWAANIITALSHVRLQRQNTGPTA